MLGRLVMVAVVLFGSAVPPSGIAPAQESGLIERVIMDTYLNVPAGDGLLTVTRLTLTDASRTESIVLPGPVSIAVEAGVAKVWTRAGAVLDGVPLLDATSTVYISRGQILVVPANVQFRIRALGCEPIRVLLVSLISRQPAAGEPRATTGNVETRERALHGQRS